MLSIEVMASIYITEMYIGDLDLRKIRNSILGIRASGSYIPKTRDAFFQDLKRTICR